MDNVLQELKIIRENVEKRLNSLLKDCEAHHASLAQEITEGMEASQNTVGLLGKCIQGLRDTIALNNARCAELARQLTYLPARRTDLMIESLEKRIETLEADFLRQKSGSDHETE